MVAGAGVVDEYVDAPTECVQRLLGHGLNLIIISDVGSDRHQFVASLIGLVDGCLIGFGSAAGDRNLGAGFR